MLKALIPVRSGSVRVKNKNIRQFCNSTLLHIKVEQLLRIDRVDEVCVSSDSDEMLKVAKELGATPIKRDIKYSSSESQINDVWYHIAQNIDAEHVLYTNVTNPLINDETYQRCIDKYSEIGDRYDSLNTVTMVKEFLWLNGKPLNYAWDNQPRSQDLPDVFYPNFAINILKRETMEKQRSIIGENFYPYTLGKIESIDIDDEEDFITAELLYRRTRTR